MRISMLAPGALAAVVWLAGMGPAFAAGLLRPKDYQHDDLQILSHRVRILINNGFARTEVDQTFHNPQARDLEAVYTFPLPRRASLSELSLWIDGQENVGEVRPRAQARAAYEEQKAAGQDAAVGEKDSYKSLQFSVSPVRAGKDCRVRFVYYQPLEVDTGIGRYLYPLEEGGVDDARDQAFFLNNGLSGESALDLAITLKTSYPVEAVLVPSHPGASVRKQEDGSWLVSASLTGPAALGRDFVLDYRLAADRPAGLELVPFREAGSPEGTFLVSVTPGDDLRPFTAGVDWTFILDISGSMKDKLLSLVDGVRKALEQMPPQDRFRIALFNDQARWLVEGFQNAGPEAIREAASLVEALAAGGGTDLYAGVRLGLEGLDADRPSAVLLVTDGVANHGVTEHRMFLDLARKADVRLFTFVMGNSANTPLLEDMAKASHGLAISVSNSDAVIGKILLARSKMTHEAMRDVRVEIEGADIHDQTPSRPGSLYRGDQLILLGRYRGSGPGRLRIRANISGRQWEASAPIRFPEADRRSPEIERMWALARIEDLEEDLRWGGDGGKAEDTIRDLATRYSLVTDYTSMVVLRQDRLEAQVGRRENLARSARERQAQQTRLSQPAPRFAAAYSPAPVSQSPPPRLSRNSGGGGGGGFGGGAVGPWFGLLAAGLAWLPGLRRRRQGRREP